MVKPNFMLLVPKTELISSPTTRIFRKQAGRASVSALLLATVAVLGLAVRNVVSAKPSGLPQGKNSTVIGACNHIVHNCREISTAIGMAESVPGCVNGPEAGSSFIAAARPRIILFGDSLTERGFDGPDGWAAALAACYKRRADVINRGLSGYNTRWALQTLPYVFGPTLTPGVPAAPAAAGKVLFATVFFGANDAARLEAHGNSSRQHVPLDEYRSNLEEIVSYVKATGVERVLIITPPPVSDKLRKAKQIRQMGEQARDWPLDRTFDHSGEYSKAAAAVAKELGLPCLDLFSILQKEDNWEEKYLNDGLHFTPLGQEKLGHLVMALLRHEWPEIRPVELPAQFPAWDAINFTDVKSSFVATDESS
ncbi:hypothetical protein PLESTB_001368000 [Pleodorina starrii]|uniref:SGNH hydrolase-type esterase domain-containing protein n=1 Tax=Pleodorina starrii TaxID=330485 RepID=A0A9W6BUJ2_9CHLO|nr:hypothetical protein PLESTM_000417100 [Pleodorina starrii]GLC58502.1 hypothetical protein PLESTB_001368000 [Pleodorina starrii]GLC74155.1 hypothetical protein PLESTF_001467900 [Pleodorina starrii]